MATTDRVRLRPMVGRDRTLIRSIEQEPAGNAMANVVARTADQFDAFWERIVDDPAVRACVIEHAEATSAPGDVEVDRPVWQPVGFVNSFVTDLAIAGESAERRCVGYRLAEAWWGRGIASRALRRFVADVEPRRPLWAVTAATNVASQRVLAACGCAIVERRWTDATPRYPAGDEVVFVLT